MEKLTRIDIEMLRASGLNIIEAESDGNFIAFEDPSCIFHILDSLLETASVIAAILAALMLTGWAVLYIKNGIRMDTAFKNFRNLLLVFAVLGLTKPIVNFIYGSNLLDKQCPTIKVEIDKILELKAQAPAPKTATYDVFTVYDSGAKIDTSFLDEDINLDNQNIAYDPNQASGNYFANYALENGGTIDENGGIIFPDKNAGIQKIASLLNSDEFSNQTIKEVLMKADLYDGPSNANSSSLVASLNISDDTTMQSLSDSDKQKIAQMIVNNISAQNTASSPNPNFVSAERKANSLIFINRKGEKIERSGGTIAWRHNNPGNIVNSKFARDNGALSISGKFAVFPDEQTGMNAIKKLLHSKSYNNLSIKGAIHKWAPAADSNNPERYTKQVAKFTGLSPDRKIKDLNDQELQAVANAIRRVEGWKPGKERKL